MGVPKKLYKYYGLSIDLRQVQCDNTKPCEDITNAYSVKALADRYVWASMPGFLNDPFDCQMRLTPKISKETYIRLCLAAGHTKADIDRAVKVMFDNFGKLTEAGHSQVEIIREGFFKMASLHGLICFTPDPSNILMWAHYAQGHSGFCLEFSVDDLPEWKSHFARVEYEQSNLLPLITFENLFKRDKNGRDMGNQLILSKAKMWSYEREWRLIVDEVDESQRNFGGQPVYYNDEALTGIIFGPNINPKHQKILEELAPANDYRSHYECVLDDRKFKYRLSKIS